MAISEGVYVIMPRIAQPKTLAVDISGNGTTHGANVMSYGYMPVNKQKWYIKQLSNGHYQILSVKSGLYMEAENGVADWGTNIRVGNYISPADEQEWKITQKGQRTIDGVVCPIVTIGSYVTSDGNTWMMDLKNGYTSSNTNIRLWQKNDAIAQDWYLVPTHKLDENLACPTDTGVNQNSIFVQGGYIKEGVAFNPSWICPTTFNYNGTTRYFETCYRSRYMDSDTSKWNAWSDWTAWTKPAVTRQGTSSRYYETAAKTISYDFDDYKNAQFEFKLRSAIEPADGYDVRSLVKSTKLNVFKKPSVTFTSCGWSPEGLRFSWTNDDYTKGAVFLTIREVRFDGAIVYKGNVSELYSGVGSGGAGLIPSEKFRKWAQDGQRVTIKYDIGYDQCGQLNQLEMQATTVTFDAGTVSAEPTFVEDGAKLIAVVRDLGDTRMWIGVDDSIFECYEDESYIVTSGYKAFEVPYPMRKAFYVYTSTSNATDTQWGTDVTEHEPINRFANAWSFKGGSAYLIYSSDRPEIATNYDPTYESNILDNREHETVSYAKTIKVHKDVTGSLVPEHDTSTISDFEDLLSAGHALFRSMNGEIFEVAITNINALEVNNSYTEVTVSMIVETR